MIQIQARALCRSKLDQGQSGVPEWAALVAMEDALTDDLERLELFSDEDAEGVKELRSKLRSVRVALDWMTERDLDPGRLRQG